MHSFQRKCLNVLNRKPPVVRDQAADGVADMIKGYQKVAQLSLPPGAALIFARLRGQLAELESIVSNAAPAESRPWRMPLPEEQGEWEQAYKDGGILLRRQLCSVSVDKDEWFLGGLFISDAGIAFDTGSSHDSSARFNTGFLTWKAIETVHRDGSSPNVALTLHESSTVTRLHLHLSFPQDAEWLEEFWKLCNASKPIQVAPPAGETIDTTKKEGNAEEGGSVLLQQLSQNSKAFPEDQENLEDGPKAHRSITLDSKVSAQYNQAVNGRPAFQVPEKDTPVGKATLKGMNLDAVLSKLQSDNWLPKSVLQDSKGATNIEATPWAESRQTPGVLVRKGTFSVPVPQDFPKAVTRLVNLPSETRCTAVFRLHPQADQVVFTVQMCSHDIPFGESFRVHETVVFRPTSDGNAEAIMWVEVLWIANLPWTYSVLKSIIESKSKADGLGTRVVNAAQKR